MYRKSVREGSLEDSQEGAPFSKGHSLESPQILERILRASLSYFCVSSFVLQGQNPKLVKFGQEKGSATSREIAGKEGQNYRCF